MELVTTGLEPLSPAMDKGTVGIGECCCKTILDRGDLTMPKPQCTKFLATLTSCLSPVVLDQMGAETAFVTRFRTITPAQLVPALIADLGAGRVETLADLCRSFSQFAGVEVDYKSFHDRLAREAFPRLMREVFTSVSDSLILRVLRFLPGNPFGRFKHILIQDGTSFALQDALAEMYPGRFNKVSPAAVELHATVDLCTEALTEIALTPDTTSERDALPLPETLAGSLLLADRGYPSFEYMRDLDVAGAHYLMRGKLSVGYEVLGRFERGVRIDLGKPVRIKELLATTSDGQLDLWVRQTKDGDVYDCRMIAIRTREGWTILLTNLPAADFSAEQVGLAYRLRWQIELMFKEWKSYANLHRFATENAWIAEGLIWASLCAAILKRFLAHAAQHVGKVAISTRKAAMMIGGHLHAILNGLRCDTEQANQALAQLIALLISQCGRAHPDRDVRSGRLQIGLRPAFQC